ncbi:hypothetical protein BBD42_16110 [Paenibacillus sp. BIHB 4019]|uniref:DNA 3'-5' helicase n=1 Tax=Paenibacillus sp. BIHB 4019 TaxID=1870819 RepID=A0A1B2DJE1_9BACL|nr:UvrD-helicase domain-containing protein [Paenibacillus sp. BIHB 4019]ANY67823.1 hypothetical protein BBD42_16110 [Paenibacillus sp. BIHB 4019]
MVTWIIKIKRYFQKQKALKLIPKIEMYLLLMQEKYKKIAIESNQVADRYVPNSYFQELLSKCDLDRAYLEGDSPFRIAPGFEQQFNKLTPLIATLPQYNELCQLHTSTRNQFQVQYRSIQARKAEMAKRVERINVKVHYFFEELAVLKQDYIAESAKTNFVNQHKEPLFFYEHAVPSEIEESVVLSYLALMRDFDKKVVSWNQEYVQSELMNSKEFFDDIDGKSLDEQQRIAVLTDEDNNLVLAGAGSGKTLTISGKVKFLTENKGISPDEILLISFTNKAAEEMQERIVGRLGVKVDVKTFHKLGMGIIAWDSDAKPDVLNDNKQIIQDYFRSVIHSNPMELEKIVTFFGVYLNIPKDLQQFDSLGEFHENQKSLDFESLKGKLQKVTKILQSFKGETMKSLEETLVANFLFLNGIEYIYENDYEYPTASTYYRQYKPDFYLPDYGIYIEHFGITKDFRTPWLSNIEEEKYLEGVRWKRALHKEKNTVLIESYSYYNKNGVLFEKLEENLRKHGVQFEKIDVKAVYEAICIKENDFYFEEFIKLVSSFINLFKSNGFKKEHFSQFTDENQQLLGHNTFLKTRNQTFLSLVEPIYEYYQDTLGKQNKIDFNDMINTATEIAKGKKATFHYKYIIIDEYQDISQGRYQLIKTIKDKTNAKVVCVGDDWQSIYRFAGSDVQLFTKFGENFGKFELLRIERTYRNSQQLINIAGSFVMKNMKQYRKNLVSGKYNTQPIRVIGYDQNMVEVIKAILDEIIDKGGQKQEIMLLGRNNFDINFLKGQTDFRVIEKEKVLTRVEYQKHKSVKINFMSTHKSKGLEADQVILINAKNNLLGFPNRISDDPVLSWVLTDQDAFEFAEERRLFYVALTRTKNNLYIMAPEKDTSIFIKELTKDYGTQFETTFIQNSITNNPRCLKCKTGLLVERKNKLQKNFLGCSHYPQCKQTHSDVCLLNNQVMCSRCNGYMARRTSKGEEFYGCTNFPHCRNTMNIGKSYHRVKQIR